MILADVLIVVAAVAVAMAASVVIGEIGQQLIRFRFQVKRWTAEEEHAREMVRIFKGEAKTAPQLVPFPGPPAA